MCTGESADAGSAFARTSDARLPAGFLYIQIGGRGWPLRDRLLGGAIDFTPRGAPVLELHYLGPEDLGPGPACRSLHARVPPWAENPLQGGSGKPVRSMAVGGAV